MQSLSVNKRGCEGNYLCRSLNEIENAILRTAALPAIMIPS